MRKLINSTSVLRLNTIPLKETRWRSDSRVVSSNAKSVYLFHKMFNSDEVEPCLKQSKNQYNICKIIHHLSRARHNTHVCAKLKCS